MLEKTIEHTSARQVECEAVLQLKVRACAELNSSLERAQQAEAEAQAASVDSENFGESPNAAKSEDGMVTPGGESAKNKPKRVALAALPANNASGRDRRSPARSPSSAVEVARGATESVSTPSPYSDRDDMSESMDSSAYSHGVSPLCVSWHRGSGRQCIFPEWIELAITMGYEREFTDEAVKELLRKPNQYHTFDAFVDTLDRITPRDEGNRNSHDLLRAQIKELEEARAADEELHQSVLSVQQNSATVPEDLLLCNICCERKVAIVFKCGHMKCEECATFLTTQDQSTCPDCRERLTSPRKAFLP